MVQPPKLSLPSDAGHEQLKQLEEMAAKSLKDVEGLVDRLNRAITEFDPYGEFTNDTMNGKIILHYNIRDFFYADILREESISYRIEIDYHAKILELIVEPESVTPRSPLSAQEIAGLKTDEELLWRVNLQVNKVLLEYAQDNRLSYRSPFRYQIPPPEGQGHLAGFADKGEGAAESVSG